MQTERQKIAFRLKSLVFFSIIMLLVAAIWPPIAQTHAYHQFADQRLFLDIPNFMNVVSNLAILFSGLAGLLLLWRLGRIPDQQVFMTSMEYWPYRVLFVSVVMTSLGSAYYHWAPDNNSLLWDRLSIAIGVTALLAAVLSERINVRVGLWSLPALVLLGIGSVLYWRWSEQQGNGNLNFYIVVQFYTLLLIVFLSMLLPSRYTHGGEIIKVIGLYAVAKVAETLDQHIFALGKIISGHTIKHLLAALAIWWIVKMLQKRVCLVDGR